MIESSIHPQRRLLAGSVDRKRPQKRPTGVDGGNREKVHEVNVVAGMNFGSHQNDPKINLARALITVRVQTLRDETTLDWAPTDKIEALIPS